MSLYSKCPPSLKRWILSQRPGVTESDLEREDYNWISAKVVDGLNVINKSANYSNIDAAITEEYILRVLEIAALYCGMNPKYMDNEDPKYNVVYIILFVRKNGVKGLISQELVDVCKNTKSTTFLKKIMMLREFTVYDKVRLLVMLYKSEYPEWAPWFINQRYYKNWLINNKLSVAMTERLKRVIVRINSWLEGNAFMQMASMAMNTLAISGQQARGEIKYQTFMHVVQALAQNDPGLSQPSKVKEDLMISILSESDPEVCETILRDASIALPPGVDPVIYLRQTLDISNLLPVGYRVVRRQQEYAPTRGLVLEKKQLLPWNLAEYDADYLREYYRALIEGSTTYDDLLVVNDEMMTKEASYDRTVSPINLDEISREAREKMRRLLNEVPVDYSKIDNLKLIISATNVMTAETDGIFKMAVSETYRSELFPRDAEISQATKQAFYDRLVNEDLTRKLELKIMQTEAEIRRIHSDRILTAARNDPVTSTLHLEDSYLEDSYLEDNYLEDNDQEN